MTGYHELLYSICNRSPSMGGDLLAWTACVSLDVDRHRRSCVIRTVIVVVVASVVVAIPVVVNAVHDDQPFLRDPFPCMACTHTPQRNGRPRPVVRMVGDVVVVVDSPGRGRMVVRRRTGVFMPCDRGMVGMMGGSHMPRRAGLGGGSRGRRGTRGLRRTRGLKSARWPRRAWSGCRARVLRRSRLLGHAWRTSADARFTTVVASLGRRDCRRADSRAGDSDDCEFHEVVVVVVHSAPSLSVLEFEGKPFSPLHCVRSIDPPFLTSPLKEFSNLP